MISLQPQNKQRKPKHKKVAVSKPPTTYSQSPLHNGIWAEIFAFLGTPKQTTKLRLVSKSWKIIYQKHVKQHIYQLDRNLLSIKESNNGLSLQENIPEDIEEAVKQILTRKSQYNSYYSSLDKKRLQHTGYMAQPPITLSLSYIAVLNFILTKNQLKEMGQINWVTCKNMILKSNFKDKLKQITPNNVTKDQITRFEGVVQAGLINYEQIKAISHTAAKLFGWAQSMVDYIKSMNACDQEVKNYIQKIEDTERKEKELIFMNEWANKIK